MRAKYVFTEAALGLWRNVTMTVAMIITMAVSLTMLGASGLLFLQVDKIKDLYYDQIQVSIFLSPEVSDEERTELEQTLATDPLVADYFYETQEEAYEQFRALFADQPDLIEAVGPESLPESFRVRLTDPERFQEIDARYSAVPGISEIVDQEELVSEIFSVLTAVQTMALVGAAVMAAAAMMLVANVIQVAAYSKRREVSVMKLVGAPNWFIQTPFVLEAMVAGLLGAILAFGALAAGKAFLIDGPLSPLADLLTPVPWRNVILTLPALAGVGALVSAITGWLTLRFYLRK
ncbi:ABC transporter permease [Natronosporangium hydrolyticum]|uniref:Cell division protein FtsX n=1 Tax=Natronosporangium hydrolyticum TaxID=2811111 RepID=A0A895YCX3_9ACTN|nr:permease-like cell division protein FtsX [Natronosporangium hydrolyticum]QSB15637.1 ABC transporter permease [Natronosporangium hydrolyticum]